MRWVGRMEYFDIRRPGTVFLILDHNWNENEMPEAGKRGKTPASHKLDLRAGVMSGSPTSKSEVLFRVPSGVSQSQKGRKRVSQDRT